jgi:hypothetical protein
MTDVNENASLTIPSWFIRLTAGAIALAIPWAVWVTIQLATISVRIETAVELRDDLGQLASRFSEHLSDPALHHAGMRDVNRRLDRIEKQIEREERR